MPDQVGEEPGRLVPRMTPLKRPTPGRGLRLRRRRTSIPSVSGESQRTGRPKPGSKLAPSRPCPSPSSTLTCSRGCVESARNQGMKYWMADRKSVV